MNELPCSPRILVDVASAALRIGNILQASRHQLGADESLKNTFIYFTNMLMSGLAEANSEDVKCPSLMESIGKIKAVIDLSIKSTPGTYVSSGCLHVLDGYSTTSLGENLYRNDFHLTANEIWSITFSTKFWPLPFGTDSDSSHNFQSQSTNDLDKRPGSALREFKSSSDELTPSLRRHLMSAALIYHFQYQDGYIGNKVPLGPRQLEELTDKKVKKSTCSEFMRKMFLGKGEKRDVDDQIRFLLENDEQRLVKILSKMNDVPMQSLGYKDFGLDEKDLDENMLRYRPGHRKDEEPFGSDHADSDSEWRDGDE